MDFEHNAKLLTKPLKVTCSSSAKGLNVFDIDAPFKTDYQHDDADAAAAGVVDPRKIIKIVFTQSRNPLSAMDIRGLKISTLTPAGKLVDVYDSGLAVLFTVAPAPFYKASVAAEQTETSTESAFTFSFTLANTVLAGGYLELVVPPELPLPHQGANTQNELSVKPIKNMDAAHTKCVTTLDKTGNVVIKVIDFIS